jgi:septation ring formation regulator EzrA
MFLSFSGYQEAVKEQKHKDEKIDLIEKQLEAQSNQLKALISAANDQKQVNQMARTLYSSILNVHRSMGASNESYFKKLIR